MCPLKSDRNRRKRRHGAGGGRQTREASLNRHASRRISPCVRINFKSWLLFYPHPMPPRLNTPIPLASKAIKTNEINEACEWIPLNFCATLDCTFPGAGTLMVMVRSFDCFVACCFFESSATISGHGATFGLVQWASDETNESIDANVKSPLSFLGLPKL